VIEILGRPTAAPNSVLLVKVYPNKIAIFFQRKDERKLFPRNVLFLEIRYASQIANMYFLSFYANKLSSVRFCARKAERILETVHSKTRFILGKLSTIG